MRLKKLLLGSTAAMFVVGAGAGTANAADVMNGLVVTQANYLESCSSGNGIQFSTWCFHFSGSSVFETEFGYEIDYGTDPTLNTVDPVGGTFPWSGFDLTNKLALTATRDFGDDKTITVRIPIVGSGTTSLAIAKAGGATWTFTSSSVTVNVPTNFADFTLAVAEGGAHPWYPDVDGTAEFDFGNFEITVHGGIGWDDADLNGNATPLYFEPDADLTLAYSGDTFSAEMAAHWDWVDIGGTAYTAWGVEGEIGASFNMFSMELGAAYSVNNDYSGNYNYDIVGGDRIVSVWGEIGADWSDMHSTTLDVTYATSLVTANSSTLEITLGHDWMPADGLTVGAEVWYQRAFSLAGEQAIGGGLTLTVPIN